MKFLLCWLLLSYGIGALGKDGLEEKIERNWNESLGVSKLYSGFSNTTFNLGVSHERRKGSLGVDALLLYSGDNGQSNGFGSKDRQMLIGSSLIHHLQDNSPADVYFGTGLALMRHEDVGTTDDDKTTFGPLFRVGSSYYVHKDWSLGLEYMTALNWSNDDVSGEQSYGFLTLGYTY